MKLLSLLIAFVLAFSIRPASAQTPPTHPASPEFERMKTLVGTWKGTADMGQGPKEMTIEYRLISGGTALEERIFAGTPMEMVTMYHDQKGTLRLTHYCMLGNSPGMVLKSSDPKTLKFDFDPKCGVSAKSEMHMHSMALTFVDADTITQNWELFDAGKAKDSHPFTLKRVKAGAGDGGNAKS
ncbi:MAG: hypothetical protein JWQ04_2630 [Pedosphaera sp.]|nr:hypothetical protein [Pedosphaera sp.]